VDKPYSTFHVGKANVVLWDDSKVTIYDGLQHDPMLVCDDVSLTVVELQEIAAWVAMQSQQKGATRGA
jgi:hypothetical protein